MFGGDGGGDGNSLTANRFNYKKFHNGLFSQFTSASTPVSASLRAKIATPISVVPPPPATTTSLQQTSFTSLNGKKFQHDDSSSLKFDANLRRILISTVILLIIYKSFVFLIPYTKTNSFSDISSYITKRMENVLFSSSSSSSSSSTSATHSENLLCNTNFMLSLFSGIGFAIFSWMIVYLDSSIPGIYPASPFTKETELSYFQLKTTSMHLGYITALASGIVVSCLTYYEAFN